jgi:IPT/TIG domain
VLGAGIALVVSLNGEGHPGVSTPASSNANGSKSAAPAHASSNAPSPSTHATSPASQSAGGTIPVLSSLSPSTGAAGQAIVVSGSDFMSANGVVEAHFGSQVAPTACPVQTTCTVTVPAITGSSTSVPVTITTDGGTSNALTFDYGS